MSVNNPARYTGVHSQPHRKPRALSLEPASEGEVEEIHSDNEEGATVKRVSTGEVLEISSDEDDRVTVKRVSAGEVLELSSDEEDEITSKRVSAAEVIELFSDEEDAVTVDPTKSAASIPPVGHSEVEFSVLRSALVKAQGELLQVKYKYRECLDTNELSLKHVKDELNKANTQLEHAERKITNFKAQLNRVANGESNANKEVKEKLDILLHEHATCVVCQGVMWDPYILTMCGHSFCRGCLQTWFTNKFEVSAGIMPCPYCREGVYWEPTKNFFLGSIIHTLAQAADVIPPPQVEAPEDMWGRFFRAS